jgi:F-type H+-transporting ATPase subunit epsilon
VGLFHPIERLTPDPSRKREGGELKMALHFELVTPVRLVRSEEVHMVVVPGTEGEFGVLAGHAPVMSTIADGALKVYKTDGAAPEEIRIFGGFAEVSDTGLTVLAERVED